MTLRWDDIAKAKKARAKRDKFDRQILKAANEHPKGWVVSMNVQSNRRLVKKGFLELISPFGPLFQITASGKKYLTR